MRGIVTSLVAITAVISPVCADNLFGTQASKGELAIIEERAAGAERSLRGLQKIHLMFIAHQMQRGDCSPGLEIEGKAKSGD